MKTAHALFQKAVNYLATIDPDRLKYEQEPDIDNDRKNVIHYSTSVADYSIILAQYSDIWNIPFCESYKLKMMNSIDGEETVFDGFYGFMGTGRKLKRLFKTVDRKYTKFMYELQKQQKEKTQRNMLEELASELGLCSPRFKELL